MAGIARPQRGMLSAKRKAASPLKHINAQMAKNHCKNPNHTSIEIIGRLNTGERWSPLWFLYPFHSWPSWAVTLKNQNHIEQVSFLQSYCSKLNHLLAFFCFHQFSSNWTVLGMVDSAQLINWPEPSLKPADLNKGIGCGSFSLQRSCWFPHRWWAVLPFLNRQISLRFSYLLQPACCFICTENSADLSLLNTSLTESSCQHCYLRGRP